MSDILIHWLFLIIVVEAISEIIVAAKITDWFRAFLLHRAAPNLDEYPELVGKELPYQSLFVFLHSLFTCGYCTSVWIAGAIAVFAPWVYRFNQPDDSLFVKLVVWIVNWFLATMILHRLSNWFHVLYSLIQRGRVKTYDIAVTQHANTQD
jgi:hypothetical protein